MLPVMSYLAKAGGAVTGVGAIATALVSPVVPLVVGVLVLVPLVAIVVVVLTAARTSNEYRHEQSMAVLDRLLPWRGTPTPTLPPDSTAASPAPYRRRWRRPSST